GILNPPKGNGGREGLKPSPTGDITQFAGPTPEPPIQLYRYTTKEKPPATDESRGFFAVCVVYCLF
ncbi:MAG: hypothetical protein LBB93_02345, partial [Elusimicrobiota bacterium]|nr:hypothetical protein [Elusimicrobiota bacterium]